MKTIIKYIFLIAVELSISISAVSQEFNWVNIIGDSGFDAGRFIAIDEDDNTYSSGYFEGIVDFDLSSESMYLGLTSDSESQFIQKLNPNGELQWITAFDRSSRTLTSLTLDRNDNIIITGKFLGVIDFDPSSIEYFLESGISSTFGSYEWNPYVMKLDPSGNLIWAKGLIGEHFEDDEDNYRSQIIKSAIDDANNIFISGLKKRTNTIDFDPGPDEYELHGEEGTYILKLNTNGEFIWVRMLDSPIRDFIIDDENNIVITGEWYQTVDFDPGPDEELHTAIGSTPDLYVLKLNELGDFVWLNTYQSASNQYGSKIKIDTFNNILVSGRFGDTLDFDSGSDVFELTNILAWDTFILKLTESGDFIYAKQIGGVNVVNPTDMVLDNLDNIYLTGTFKGTIDFDPNAEVYNLISSELEDIFVVKLDTNGIFDWAIPIQSESQIRSSAITINDSMEEIYVTGQIRGITDFDPTEEEELYDSNDFSLDIFILKLGQESLNIEEFDSVKVEVFPNPMVSTINLIVEHNGTLEIFDNLARIIEKHIIHQHNNVINVEHLENGIYFARISTEKGVEVVKLIKQ